MNSKPAKGRKRSARDRGRKRPVSTPDEVRIACEDDAVEELAEALEEELEEELEEQFEEQLEEVLEEELEEEREQGFREEVEQAVLDSLSEASNALTAAEIALTASLDTMAQAQSQIKDAHAAGGKALERVVFAWNGVAELIQNEEPEGGSAVISEAPEIGVPDDDDAGAGPAEGKKAKSPENDGAKGAAAKSAERRRPKAPESGIVAQARAVEREARALAETQTPAGDPGD